jgi:peptidoglycan/LPS O-acetylase OafA/YrhL
MSATSTSDPRIRDALQRLGGLRWLAAVHLFVFHLRAVHVSGRQAAEPSPLSIPLFDLLPEWLDRFCERGYCATSLFFLLSGFTLRWLYVDHTGQLTVAPRVFWRARMTRLFPLHIALLILIAPLVAFFASGLAAKTFCGAPVSTATYLAIGFVLSATLTQAWFPEYALSWNFPTWALSTVAFFYAVFPWTTRMLRTLPSAAQGWLAGSLPFVSLVPPAIYLWVCGEDRQMMFDGVEFWKQFWNEFVMRTPLFWWPHFVLGMLLAGWSIVRPWPTCPRIISLGDISGLALLAILVAPEWVWSEGLGMPAHWLRLMLRHGLLAPLHVAVIVDLAAGRGLFAKVLEWRWLAKLGDASFSLFMWQLPMIALSPLWKWLTGVAFSAVAETEPERNAAVALVSFALLLAITTGVAVASAAVERRVTRRLRR